MYQLLPVVQQVLLLVKHFDYADLDLREVDESVVEDVVEVPGRCYGQVGLMV